MDITNMLFARGMRMNREPIKALADIICNQMGINQDRVFLLNDNRQIPNDSELYVTLDIIMQAPFGADVKYKETTLNNQQVYQEVQSMAIKQTIVVSLVSKNSDARLRAYEVQMAMNSTYSEQSQETNGFHIASISPIHNRSFLEASSRLNRFDTEIAVITGIEKTQNVGYYDTFEHTEMFEG